MIVWVDMLILENFIVNFFLLTITAQTLNVKLNIKRGILSALISALYTLTLFVKPLSFMLNAPLKIVIAFFIVLIAFGRKNILLFIKITLVFTMYTFVLAGIIVFLEYKNSSSPVRGLMINRFSSKTLILVMMIIYLVVSRVVSYILDKLRLKTFTYTIEISTDKCTMKLKALLDTGNELKEPVSNLPVIIVEKNCLKNFDYDNYDKLYIPYKVVDGSANVLQAFKPKGIKVYKSNNECQLRNAVVAICENKLSPFGEYNALLSRDMI